MKSLILPLIPAIFLVLFQGFVTTVTAQQNCVYFSTATTGNYISIANSASLNPSNITVEAWINIHSTTSGGCIVCKGTGGGGEEYSLDLGGAALGSPGTARFYFWKVVSSVNTPFVCTNTATISADTWYHLAGVYDGTNLTLYVNGVAGTAVAGPAASGLPPDNGHVVSIGSRQSAAATYDLYVQGYIDEVRIYNSALSQAQIQTDMYRELQTPTTPKAYYKFNGTSGQYNDLSGNSNNGTVTGSGISTPTSTAPIPFFTIAATAWTTATTWASGQGVPPSTNYTDVSINNSVSLLAANTLRDVTITSSATFSDGGNQLTSAGALYLTSGSFSLGSGTASTSFPAFSAGMTLSSGTTVIYASGSGTAQSVSAVPAYRNLTFSGTAVKTIATGATVSVAENWAVGSPTTMTTTANVSVTGNISGSGSITAGSGTITIGGNWTNNGTFTAGTGTVNYSAGSGGQTVGGVAYYNLTLSNSSGLNTAGGSIAVNTGAMTTTSGGTLDMGTTNILSGTGTFTGNSGTIKTSVPTSTSTVPITVSKSWGGTIEYGASGGSQTVVGGTYNNLTLDNSGGTNTAGNNLVVNGTLTTTTGGTLDMGTTNILSGTGTFTGNNGTIKTSVPTSTSAAPIPLSKLWGGTIEYSASGGSQTVVTGTYTNLKLDNSSGTNSAGNTLVVNGTLTTTAGGILEMFANSLSGLLGTINNGGSIRTTGTIVNGKTWNGDIEYYGAGGQTVASGTYFNCRTTTAGNYTAGGNISVSTGGLFDNGGATNVAAVLDMGTNTLSGPGTIGNNNATIRFGGATNGIAGWTSGIIEYYGAASQIIATGNYGCLKLNNSNGATMNGDVNVNGILTDNSGGTPGTLFLTSGILNTGGYTLTVIASNSISGSSSSNYVSGKLALGFSGAGSKAFPIGKGGNYRSLTFNYSSFDAANTVTAEQIEGSIPGSTPANTVMWSTRYWTISQSGASSVNYFVTVDGTGFSPTYTAIMIKGDGSTNTSYPATFSSPNYTNTNAFTSFSNFGLGQTEIATITTAGNNALCYGLTSVNLTATVSPNPGGGTVEFFVNNISAGTAPVIGGIATKYYDPSSLSAGSYTIKANFSGNGDYLSSSSDPSANGTLTVNPLPVFTITPTNISCNGASDGKIRIDVTTGTSPFQFTDNNGSNWSASSGTPYLFTGLLPNFQYKVRVSDFKGCITPQLP